MTATPKLQPNHALDLFEKYLAAHNKSPNTICVYRYAVEQFYHLYPQLTPRNLQLCGSAPLIVSWNTGRHPLLPLP